MGSAFTKKLAAWYSRQVLDPEWVLLQLESHHLLKDSFLDATKHPALTKELAEVFGWKSIEDMDSVLPHEVFHNRSPKRFSLNPATKDLKGAEQEISLSKQLDAYIAAWETKNGNITTVRQLLNAHKGFYATGGPKGSPFSRLLWSEPMSPPESDLVPGWWLQDRTQVTSVESWFAAVGALLDKLGK